MTANIGDRIIIDKMDGEPDYAGRTGVVTHVDDFGQLHGSWGGCAVIPQVDEFRILGGKEK